MSVSPLAQDLHPIWTGIDALIDRAGGLRDLRSHRIELLAARRWRALGRPIPPELAHEEVGAGMRSLAVQPLLERIRDALDGPVVLLKGPEVAARYVEPTIRAFRDLDVLVQDAERAQRALLAAGFHEVGDPELYVGIHHLRPLAYGRLPLLVEVHSQPKWIAGVEPPSADELLAVLVPSNVGVAGISTLPPARHAVVMAVHSWAHEPLRRIRDLLDVAVLAESADRDDALAISRSWGAERVWRTTIRAADAVLLDGAAPWMLRVWARNLRMARERTVLESHLGRLLSNFSALPPAEALRALPDVLAAEILPKHDETWPTKLRRTRKALRNAFLARSEHDSASTAGSCGGQPEERGT